jgi:hypothetical protein
VCLCRIPASSSLCASDRTTTLLTPHLLNADGALDGLDTTFPRDKVRVEIGDASETVASELERVGQRTDAILARVKGVLAVMREGGFAVLDTSVGVVQIKMSHIQVRPSLRRTGGRTVAFPRSRRRGMLCWKARDPL